MPAARASAAALSWPEPDAAGACPCGRLDGRGRALIHARCCGPYLRAEAAAPDAPSLMRSRYTAFVSGRADYLLATWHASTRPQGLELQAELRWLGLELRAHRLLDEAHAEVEFVARSKLAGRAHRLHERSRFLREDGRWWYVDGDFL